MGWLVGREMEGKRDIVWSFCESAAENGGLSGGHSVCAEGAAGFVVVPFVEKPGSESGVCDKERTSISDIKPWSTDICPKHFSFGR